MICKNLKAAILAQKKIITAVSLSMCMLAYSMTSAEVFVHTTAENPESAHYSVVPAGDAIPKVTARSAVVIEAKTGKVLYERNMDQVRYPASTTKMMTLLVALENSKPEDIVTVGKNAYNVEGSTMWLEEGERLKMEDLEYGIMLVSGNDATVAIAEHVAGSVPKFAEMMNKKAEEIGATSTHFVNCNGLPAPNHYTTAHDLAKIAAHGFNNVPDFERIVSTKERRVPGRKNPDTELLRNENLLLHIYKGCNGVKTGYTDAAGRCVVTAAKRNGVQLVSVVLDGLYMWDDSILMLDYGFTQVDPFTVVKQGEKLEPVEISGGEKNKISVSVKDEITVGCKLEDRNMFKKEVVLNKGIEAPVKMGDIVGKMNVLYEGKVIGSADIISNEAVAPVPWYIAIWNKVRSFFGF